MMKLFLEDLKSKPSTFILSKVLIKIYGRDAEQYLNSQTTNGVLKLEVGGFQFNSILDISGKIVSSFILCRISQLEFNIVISEAYARDTLERLEKYHISEEFELELVSIPSYLKTHSSEDGVRGTYFFDNDVIVSTNDFQNISSSEDFNTLKTLSGVPELGREVQVGVLINNTRLDELSVDYEKGCFPGQETVSKINTRRGAAFKPVLAVISKLVDLNAGEKIIKNGKKIGETISSTQVDGQTFLNLNLLRELRIDKSALEFEVSGMKINCNIHYFPYLVPSKLNFAIELYDFANELFLSESYQESISYFEKAIKVDPSFEDAYESLGVLYGRLENYDKAIELMEMLKSINPKCMMALTNLSLYHMKKGNIETAEDYKSQATFLNFEVLGDEAEKKRKEDELKAFKLAERDKREGMFRQVIELDDEDSMANNGMGEIELERGNYSVAEKYFRTAIVGNERYSVAFLGLGKSLYQQNKIPETIEVLNHGIAVAGKNGDLMPANEMQALLAKLIK